MIGINITSLSDGPIRFVVFDCDGTLVDSAGSIIEAMAKAWEMEGLSPPEPLSVRSVVGLHLDEAISRLHPGGSLAVHNRMAESFREFFNEIRDHSDHDELLFPGTLEVINELDHAGILLGIATGKSRHGLKETLDRNGLMGRFVNLKTSDDGPGKPNPTILLDAIKEVGVTADNTVMIGDTTYDIAMAVNASVNAIGVNWGYHTTSELKAAGAIAMLKCFKDLSGTLHALRGTR